jgi:hypothetical protein
MGIAEFLGLFAAMAGGWFFWDSLKAREAANAAMRTACKAERLLFLDDTVALESVWLTRDNDGHLKLRRVYGFEYSDTGQNRREGSVVMGGDTVSIVDVGFLTVGETPR